MEPGSREKSSVFEESLMRRISGSSSVHTLSKAAFIEKVRESNAACQSGDFTTGLQLYTEAIAADPQNCILYSNRSAVLVKVNEYERALDDAVKARLLNPKWSKRFVTIARKDFRKSFIITFRR